jgi:hypothetical protein
MTAPLKLVDLLVNNEEDVLKGIVDRCGMNPQRIEGPPHALSVSVKNVSKDKALLGQDLPAS